MKSILPESIETGRLWIRRLRYEDAEEIFYVYASKPEATRFVSWPTHQNIDHTREFLKYANNGWEQGADYSYGIRLKSNNRFIGSFGIVKDPVKIQFGYIFGPIHWGNGYATEVCTRMMMILKSTPWPERIGTFVDTENTASSRVLLKAGLVEESRLPGGFKFVNQNFKSKDCIYYRLPR